jgi:DNA-binding response OmpR family regulator
MGHGFPNVLIVDDETETLKLLKLALERNGFAAFTAENWNEVSNQIKKILGLKQKVDIVILDLMMPVRSGFDILLALQVVLSPVPPVIMLSVVTGIEQQIQARDLGVTKYLTKPTTPTKLIQVINDILSR